MLWDKYQLETFRVTEETTRNVVVNARAGSGKTTTALHLLELLPSYLDTLMTAFNRTVRDELQRRAPDNVEVLTLHQLGLRMMRNYGKWDGEIDGNKGRKIARKVIAEYLAEHRKLPRSVASHLRRSHYGIARLSELTRGTLAKDKRDVLRLVYHHMPEMAEHALDVANIVIRCVHMSRNQLQSIDYADMLYLPIYQGISANAYDFVVVDEAQDLSPAQLCLAKKVCNGRLFAIGDPRQAIYGWRGADSYSMKRIVEEMDAIELPLSVTYRCAKKIVSYVKSEVSGLDDLEARPNAPDGLVERIDFREMLDEKGARVGDFIIARTNAPLMAIALHYLDRRVPCTVMGREIGASLLNLIDMAGQKSVKKLENWLIDYKIREHTRLEEADLLDTFYEIGDRVDAVLVLAETCSTIKQIKDTILDLFSDEGNERSLLTLSTVHRAKGLERNRVFLLTSTFNDDRDEEEDNVYYVACTRAEEGLFLVDRPRTSDDQKKFNLRPRRS